MAYNSIFKYERIPVVYSVSIANIHGQCKHIKREGGIFCLARPILCNWERVNFLENKNHLSTNLMVRKSSVCVCMRFFLLRYFNL